MKYAFVILMLLLPLHAEKLTTVQAQQKTIDLVWASQSELHKRFTEKFVETPDFGKSRLIWIDLDKRKTLRIGEENYRVQGVELISVTDRKKPVIWQHGNFINTKSFENKQADKRELKKSELAVFDKIKKGKGIIASKENGQLTMMGVLKSEKSCIRCHKDSKEGELMGAFKYTFYEIKTQPAPKNIKEKKKKESEKETQKQG